MRVICFNLVPYRDSRRQEIRLVFLAQVVSSLVAAVLFAYLITTDLDRRLSIKNDFLAQLEKVQSDISERVAIARALSEEKEVLQQRIQILRSVDQRSLRQSLLFSVLDDTRPELSSLNRLGLSKNTLSVSGTTGDLPELSAWVTSLKSRVDLFEDIAIVQVQRASVNRNRRSGEELALSQLHDFDLTFTLTEQKVKETKKTKGAKP